jgi:8-oxo-dGTP pyrophosphatase MutT (NUDIX family)
MKHVTESRPDLELTLATIRARLRAYRPVAAAGAADPLLGLPSELSAAEHKQAAVAAVLREAAGGPEVLLIRRAEHPRDPWSGHMAFPGGRHDPQDTDLEATVVRETLEELGLDLLRDASFIARLDDLPAIARGRRTGLMIAPFVFELTSPRVTLTYNYEVAEALWTPLLPLMRGERATTTSYVYEGRTLELPAHDVEGRIVWGLTYKMLDALFERLRG